MDICMITFRSVTPAQRGEGLLRRAGMDCTLRRTPRRMEQQGCGYSLHLPVRYVGQAVSLLREHQVPFRKVYLQREGASPEEMNV